MKQYENMYYLLITKYIKNGGKQFNGIRYF
jgi:hypothetical protein